MKDLILDCESFESALASLSRAYSVDESIVIDFLRGIDLDGVPYTDLTVVDHLRGEFESSFSARSQGFSSVMWFHGTRTARTQNFRSGLLPLSEALPSVWDLLRTCLSDEKARSNLDAMRAGGVQDKQFCWKQTNGTDQGPFAMLVREALITPSQLTHNYLEIPELIEDICNGYEKQFKHSIRDEVTGKLSKCIVKFKSHEVDSDYLITKSLYYLWGQLRSPKEFDDIEMNTCFDGNGHFIPRYAIESITFID